MHTGAQIRNKRNDAITQFLTSYFKPPRMLQFTKLGVGFIFFAFGIGLSAMNTGNNLLYMIFGMILGFITASGIISEISLRKLDLDWILEDELFASKRARLRLIVRNSKIKLPSFGIEATVDISPINDRSKIFSLKKRFLFIAAKSHQAGDLFFIPESRGVYRIERVKIETSFPFGFFRKYFFKELNYEFIVYPKIIPLEQSVVSMPKSRESQPRPFKGRGDSFWGLKEFVEGDNPRLISWKNSAKFGKIVVKETEMETEQKIWISLEPQERWKKLNKSEFESALSFAASYLIEIYKRGFSIGLFSRNAIVPPGRNKKILSEILKVLAVFNPNDSNEKFNSTPSFTPFSVEKEKLLEILTLWRQLDG